MDIVSPTLMEGLKALNCTPDIAVKEFVLMHLSERLSIFSNESKSFEHKYGLAFPDFEKKILSRKDEENFDEYDDYMAWKFADEQISLLTKKLEAVK